MNEPTGARRDESATLTGATQSAATLRSASLGGVVAACAGASLLMKLGGADLFWHLRAGQWIAQHGWSASDPFSHTADGPWRYAEALAGLLYAAVHALGGLAGLELFHVGLGALVAALVYFAAKAERPAAAVLVVGAVAAGTHAAMAPKPQMFSYVLFAALLLVRRGERADGVASVGWRDPLVCVPPLMLLWANLHRAGLLGLAVLVAAWLSAVLHRRRRIKLVTAVLVVSALALLGNPTGVFYYTSTFDVVSRASFAQHIAEWAPLTFESLWQNHAALIPLAPLALHGAWIGDEPDRRWRIGTPTLVCLGTAIMASRSGRLLPFWAISAAPLAARSLDVILSRLRQRPAIDAMALGLAGAMIAVRYFTAVPPALRGVGVVESRVPVGIAAFLRAAPPPGRMFNTLDFGGYLLFALAPGQPVFIDGRNDTLYEPTFVRDVLSAGYSPPGFASLIEHRDIGFAVVRWNGPADGSFRFLHADPSWVLVHWEDAGAVLVRRTARSEGYLAEHGYAQLSLHDGFVRAANLRAGDADARFADEVREALERAPESLSVAYLNMILEARLGNESAFRHLQRRVEQMAADRGVELSPG